MAKYWQDLSEAEKKQIVEQVGFQNYLDEVADLDYQSYFEGVNKFDIEQRILGGRK